MHSNFSSHAMSSHEWASTQAVLNEEANMFDVHWISPPHSDWPAVWAQLQCLVLISVATPYNFTPVCFAEAKSSTFAMSTSTYQSPAVSQRWNMRRSSGHVWRSPKRLWWGLHPIGNHCPLVLLKTWQRSDWLILWMFFCFTHSVSLLWMKLVNSVCAVTWILTSYLIWYTLG